MGGLHVSEIPGPSLSTSCLLYLDIFSDYYILLHGFWLRLGKVLILCIWFGIEISCSWLSPWLLHSCLSCLSGHKIAEILAEYGDLTEIMTMLTTLLSLVGNQQSPLAGKGQSFNNKPNYLESMIFQNTIKTLETWTVGDIGSVFQRISYLSWSLWEESLMDNIARDDDKCKYNCSISRQAGHPKPDYLESMIFQNTIKTLETWTVGDIGSVFQIISYLSWSL